MAAAKVTLFLKLHPISVIEVSKCTGKKRDIVISTSNFTFIFNIINKNL